MNENKKSKNILLVDDDIDVLNLLRKFFEKQVDKIFVAENGEEALEILQKEEITVVISDIKMPKMDGITLIKKIRDEDNPIPFTFLSFMGTTENQEKALEFGAFDFINKPIKIAEVKKIVDSSFSEASRQSEEENQADDLFLTLLDKKKLDEE